MSYRNRRRLGTNGKEVKVEKVIPAVNEKVVEGVVINPIVEEEKVVEEKLVEPIVIKEEVEEVKVEEVIEEKVVEEIVEVKEEKVEEVVEEVKVEEVEVKEEVKEEKVEEENKYAVEEFVIIDGKKVSKFDLEPVVCLNTGVRYDNNKIAMQETGVNSGAIKRNCRGFTKCAGKDENGKKLVWKFAKDVE